MNSILVPVDFSEASSNALTYAIKLFGSNTLEITLIHFYGARSTAFVMKNIDNVLEDDANRSMKKLLKDFQGKFPNVVFKTKIVKDYAVSAITELGNKGDYDFIVMGTAGASGLKEVFMGSVAGGVISKTSAPVIVVPKAYDFKSVKKIVFAVSDIPFSSYEVIEPLVKITRLQKSDLRLLHFAQEKTPQIERALSTLEDLNPTAEYQVGSGDINKDLSNYLKKDQADLVCLVRAQKGFVDRLFKESVTLKQTFSSPVPLLILHE
ncbi:universal stress protein [Aureitalea sp. L0-47]|uniref:universal stress protein n=1 Tax=Aureitalea sp. L0-47 TaxID=2816962 RepID=UPI0022386A55|nr:universal stress protein [Aureitalea sp. L0-47]MCW5518258.1 universal stress protein [Aureitalea sp. L0-47]